MLNIWYKKNQEKPIGQMINGFVALISNPILQLFVNVIMFFITGIFCSNAIKSNQLRWGVLIPLAIVYFLIGAIFLNVNRHCEKTQNLYKQNKQVIETIRKLIKARSKSLFDYSKNGSASVCTISENDQMLEIIMCDAIFDSIWKQFNIDKKLVEVVLFQKLIEKDKEVIRAVSYGAEETPICIGKEIDNKYRIVKAFSEQSPVKYLSKDEVLKGFCYLEGIDGKSIEQKKSEEKIHQYLAVQIRTRGNYTIAVLQISFYDIIIKDNDTVDNLIEHLIKPYCDFCELILGEHLAIEAYIK